MIIEDYEQKTQMKEALVDIYVLLQTKMTKGGERKAAAMNKMRYELLENSCSPFSLIKLIRDAVEEFIQIFEK